MTISPNTNLVPGHQDPRCKRRNGTYEASDWIGAGYLSYGVALNDNPLQPVYHYSPFPSQRILASPSRVANHSWVATSAESSDMLRRLDFVVAADDFIQVAAVNNGTVHKPLLSEAYNEITVGRTDGYHPTDTTAIDAIYQAGRRCPLIVVPVSPTSYANPLVASAAALLVEVGQETDLGNDPEETSTYDRSGRAGKRRYRWGRCAGRRGSPSRQ